jgi:hypothetical protein
MKRLFFNSFLVIPFLLLHHIPINAQKKNNSSYISQYNIVWETPSENSKNSMPLSGYNLGLNVWVENNDLLLLMGSPNCLDENGMQIKLGLIRLRFDPVIFTNAFRQELDLANGEINISGKTTSGKVVAIKLWCAANHTSAYAEIDAATPVSVTASYETWSNYDAKFVNGGLQWVHRNEPVNKRRVNDMKAQGVDEFASRVPDLLSNLTCGGQITAKDMIAAGTGEAKLNKLSLKTWSLKTEMPVKRLKLSFNMRMEQDASIDEWTKKMTETPFADLKKSRKRWQEFWNRSYIVINRNANSNDSAWRAGRNYQLSRYMLAANPSGRAMTLFNGGNFACEGNSDARNWDGCQFMGQNQMLVYWPLQRSGDFDMLKVGCDFYKNCTELRRLHAKKFWNIDGVTYPEPLSIFGLDAIGTNADGRSKPDHLHYHYTSGMVFALMMLGYDSYSGSHTANYPDAAVGIISYYDEYYQNKLAKETGKPLDANGKLVIYPSDACEPYHGCTNNIDVLAGLMALSRDLLDLPTEILGQEKRAYVKGFLNRIPEFKIEEKDGLKFYAAADKKPEWIFHNENMDFPQMYICFPFSAVSLGRSDMTLVKNAWKLGPVNAKVQHQNQCWYQNAINFARMGETRQATELTFEKLLHAGYRFPAFYHTTYLSGGSFCHTPDTDHAGSAMIALQEMLMQTDGDRIILLPAWPKDREVNFKLHAPQNTTVECVYKNGKMEKLVVTPESRRKDVVLL